MASYNTSEFRSGLKIMLDGDPYTIVENEFVKPGKGQAFNRVRVRNLKSNRTIDRTFKSGETVESADVIDVDMQYLYFDGEYYVFMDETSFEQVNASVAALGNTINYLKEQEKYTLTLWDGVPLCVDAPNFVVLTVVETDPGVRGDTATGGLKPAKMDTGAMIRVPLFIEEGELLKVDTRTGEYVSRAKE